MKNKKIIVCLIVACCVGICSVVVYLNNYKINLVQSNQSQLIGTKKKSGPKGSIKNIKNLTELKNAAKVIAEVEGTNKIEKINYKGLSCIVSTVRVKEIIKGDKSLKEIKVLQVENLDIPPQNGQRLLMFLSKEADEFGHEDNPDCYGVVGAGQGIYILEDAGTGNNSITSSDDNITLKPQAIENKDILKELKNGSYKDIKNKLK